MEIIGELKKKLTAVSMAAALMLVVLVLYDSPTTEGALSETSDNFGYMYLDNKDPDPKVSYSWVDAVVNGEKLYMGGYGAYVTRDLPWDFPFYGNMESTIWIYSMGYLCFNYQGSGQYSSLNDIPTSNGPDNLIAVQWGYPYTYNNYYGDTYIYEDPNGEWVCIEWAGTYYGLTYEVILYESGLIKMQYKDLDSDNSISYHQGSSMQCGVENRDGSDGLSYSKYSEQNMFSGLAIEWSVAITDAGIIELTEGDGPDGHICYAEYDYYKFVVNITDEMGWQDIAKSNIFFGDPANEIGIAYTRSGGGGQFRYIGDSNDYLSLDEDRTVDERFNDTVLDLRLFVKFKFDFPETGNLSITVMARGAVALPEYETTPDVFFLENLVKIEGEPLVYGDYGRVIDNPGFSAENESIEFSGFMLVYNNSFGGIYPPNECFYFMMMDEISNTYYDRNVSGRNMTIKMNMPTSAVTKEFTIRLMNISEDRFLDTFEVILLTVDTTVPPAPLSVLIHADSFNDKNTESDNDDIVYITWSRVNDLGSGVVKYRIHTSYETSNTEGISFVDDKGNEFIWNGTEHGELKIYVWAEDEVGHAGLPAAASIFIDKEDPTLPAMTFIPQGQWINTLTPICSIWGFDEGVGISGESIEYSISTNGTENFEEWISAEVYRDGSNLEIKVTPRLVESQNNWIRFRAKDGAGNGYVMSKNFNLMIDVTEVQFLDLFPTQNVWHKLEVINEREIEVYLFDETSGVDTAKIYYRISTEKDGDDYKWDTGIQQEDGWVKYAVKSADRIDGKKLIRIHFEFDGFQEGEENYIQFRTLDMAKNGKDNGWTESSMYVVKVNTKPVANILKPLNLQTFGVNELITLDATGSFDIDADRNNLKYEWAVGNITLGREMILENVRFDIIDIYNVTLYVGDSAHRYDPDTGEDTRAVAWVVIRIFEPPILDDIDTDEDGMVDLWEWEHQLDLDDPTDAAEDPDRDGYTNLDEYLGEDNIGAYQGNQDATDPWDITDHPEEPIIPPDEDKLLAPFDLIWFVLVIILAIIIGAIIVIYGYVKMNRSESGEKRQEAEEDAMLVAPQLDIPAMPPMPMIDTSVPTLPQAAEVDDSSALPPAPEEMVAAQAPPPAYGGEPQPDIYQPQPVDPMAQPQPIDPMAQPQPMEGQPQVAPNPMYEQPPAEGQNQMYQG